MKTCSKSILAVLMMAFLVLTAGSCSRYGKDKGQSTEFATFIKAYTGGIISDRSTIRIELTSNAPDAYPGADVKEGVLTFSPSINGTARWLTPKTIEFIPETGALKPGQSYTGRLRLDKIQKVSGRQFKRFSFNFLVAIKEAVLSMDRMTITAGSPEVAAVQGSISLTEELPVEKVQEMLEYSYTENAGELNVTAGEDALHFHFEILGLPRSDSDRTLKVSMKPADTGFVTDSKLEVTIPAQGNFKVLSASRVEADDPYIDIYFTEPLADMDDNTGLFTLGNVERSYVQIEGSRARIFFDGSHNDILSLSISEAVKAYDGTRLGTAFTTKFAATEYKPAVEIPVSGSILPNSKELILPFKAVNLNAVDIKVIQIYEDNVLTFLQDNDLDGSNSLRRSGRLVYKRTLRLDSDPSKNLHKWQEFSVNLSGLFRQEAGAIYRICLSFKQEYSLYGKKTSFKSGTPSDELVEISAEEMTDADEAVWDLPSPYYYESYYDWDKYEWEDRDNPTKPTYYMNEDLYPSINLLASNLGIIAQYANEDCIWVSVSNILNTDPVFNAELYVYSYQLKEIGYAKTGTDGMAEIKLSGKPFVIVAKRSGATSYLKVTEGNEKSLSRFDVGGKTLEKGLKAYIYGERGVWAPGDTIHVTMILDDRENRIPDSHPTVMELYTPQGQFNAQLVNADGKNGFYTFEVPTKADDPTGIWNAYFKIGGATFHKSLRIESVKPNRLKVNLSLGEEVIEGGQKTPVEVSSTWLTGPAASGLTAKSTMTLRKWNGSFKGFDGYTFTKPQSEFSESEYKLLETKLDKDGKAKAIVEMPVAEGAPGMLTADIVTSVEEPGGDASITSTSYAYSPYSSYVGVKVPVTKGSSFLETDKDYTLKVATVDKTGKRVEGETIEYSIYKLSWSWWWESRSENLDSYVNGTAAQPIAKGSFVSTGKDGSIPFKIDYPDWGRYLVIVHDTNSGHIAGDIMYVDWPADRGKSMKSDPDALTMLTFTTDKKSYDVGETVKVFIPASSKGHALVSLENSRKVLSREWIKTQPDQDVTYTFKVTEDMAPNFYVHISLIQPHANATNDLPIRLYGVQPVLVNDKATHLEPQIEMSDVLRPEEEFTLKVRERNGKSMTYTVAIVDEGLLDLTGFKTPDPWGSMYEREALGVRTWDLYDDVIGAFSGRFSPLFSIGGDESLITGAKKDNRFNPVVKFLGPFTLTSGSATHKIKLPMYVGSVRVMVVAGKDGAYGNADKTVPVRSPLMVLPTLPKVMGTDEKVTLPVNVFALEDGVRNATVSVRTEGPLKVVGDTEASVQFPAPGDQLVRFNLEAAGTGPAKVFVTAAGGSHKASSTISIEVRNPNPTTISTSKLTIGNGEEKTFSYTPFKTEDDEWASVELSGVPSGDYAGIFNFLKGYEFDCTEQLASKGISLLSIRNELTESQRAEADKMISDVLQQLYSRQLSSGGFAYWPTSSDAQTWVTSMVGEFLIEASQNGFSVSKGVLASWSRYQKRNVQDYRNDASKFLWDLEQAYRLYTLALNGEPESGAMNRLKESDRLSSQAAWMLAAAYSVAGKKTVATDMIGSLRTSFTDYAGDDSTFGSPVRDKAIAIEALALADMVPEAVDVAQETARALSSSNYMMQEVAFVTHAIKRLSDKAGSSAIVAELRQGDETSSVNTSKSVVSYDLDSEKGSATVKNLSDATIYATLVTSSRPEGKERVAAKASGIGLSVKYASEDGKILNPAQIQQGTDFTVTITVSNTSGIKDYKNLALTEIVPSGWEIYNDRLFASETVAATFDYKDIREDRVIWHFGLPKGTARTFVVRMRAAYEGEFILPSVKCEDLYDSRVSACTASGTAVVTR